ncbi:lanthionine synthetase C family protein [Nonomuraea aridisoli]|uniref:Lanthionine synthetase n=1 Tax=Nonomuraea aridisoli TaxID=2070368 RepID=A0A2W2EN37_9ACTN|nr:lanthionine synthetase C family protein [Nonomuraea aridisoli]PZG18015.1 lanthionine synthetase [Nonomuraea aridisoli]
MTTISEQQAARQSLAAGAAATALVHIERALNGSADWGSAHTHIRQATTGRIDAAPHAGLFYGAPAIAFVLHAAAAGPDPRYQAAARSLDQHIARLVARRVATARERIRRREFAHFAEYDVVRGLAGIGALLLRTAPASDALADVLAYVVQVTKPRRLQGEQLPGWWVAHDPDPLKPTPGGHANLGLAHGAAGLLALLSLAALRGCTVAGQVEAIERLTAWFYRWQQHSPDGAWWPHWLTREELRTGRVTQPGPWRPSWCYGTAGIARALQLAAIAVRDPALAAAAEQALAACLTGNQFARITEPGICHGIAGLYQTAYRASLDAQTQAIRRELPRLAALLADHAAALQPDDQGGLLNGPAGVGLALETARQLTPPLSGWDACLLIA